MLRVSLVPMVFLLGCAVLLGLPESGLGSIIQVNSQNDSAGCPFTASLTDLINQGQPTYSSVAWSGFTPFSGDSPSVLNDGAVGGGQGAPGQTAVTTQGSDWTLTYTLNTTVAPLGYTVAGINAISWWNADYVNQSFTLAYSTVSAPATFLTLGSFTNSYTGSYGSVFDSVSLQTALGDTTGTIANNVAQLQFVFHPIANGTWGNHQAAYREIDVFGAAATPEPATLSLLALGGLGLLRRRRKS